jgi:hypothetical protein
LRKLEIDSNGVSDLVLLDGNFRGAVVLSSTISGTSTGISACVFLNPNLTRVIVFINEADIDINAQVEFEGGELWSGRFPALSVITWVLPAS